MSSLTPGRRSDSYNTCVLQIIGLLFLFLFPVAAENPMPSVRAARAAGDPETALDLLAKHEKNHPELFELNGLAYLKARLLIESGHSREGEPCCRYSTGGSPFSVIRFCRRGWRQDKRDHSENGDPNSRTSWNIIPGILRGLSGPLPAQTL